MLYPAKEYFNKSIDVFRRKDKTKIFTSSTTHFSESPRLQVHMSQRRAFIQVLRMAPCMGCRPQRWKPSSLFPEPVLTKVSYFCQTISKNKQTKNHFSLSGNLGDYESSVKHFFLFHNCKGILNISQYTPLLTRLAKFYC